MTDQHIRFADRYFETLNATKSAIYAGYSEDTAKQGAYQLMQRDDIQTYLEAKRAEYQERTGITAEKVLREIARTSFSDIREYYTGDGQLRPICDLSDDAAAALSSIKTHEENLPGTSVVIGMNKEIKLYDKLAGLEKLARHLGLYKEDNAQQSKVIQLLNNDPLATADDSTTEDIITP